mgnify:CR=1 FL=1
MDEGKNIENLSLPRSGRSLKEKHLQGVVVVVVIVVPVMVVVVIVVASDSAGIHVYHDTHGCCSSEQFCVDEP